MKKLLLIPLLSVVSLVSAVLLFNAGLFHGRIERRIADVVGGRVQLGPMTLGFTFPLRLTVGKSQLEKAPIMVEWEALQLTVASLFPPYDVRVKWVGPRVVVRADMASGTGGGPSTGPSGDRGAPVPIRLELRIEKGDLDLPQVRLSEVELAFAQRLVMQSPASLHGNWKMSLPAFPAPLGVSLDTDSLTLSGEAIKAQGLRATVGGLTADVQGASLLKDGRHRWLLDVKAPDLSRLPAPPSFVPAKDWRGAIDLHAEVNRESSQAPWRAEGRIEAKDVRANLGVNQAEMRAEGPFALDLNARFSVDGPRAAVPVLNGKLELSGVRLAYKDFFRKPADAPLAIAIYAGGDFDQLSVRSLALTMAQVHASVSGQVGLKRPWSSDLSVDVPVVRLSGLERLSPILEKSPVSGELAVKARIHGPLADPSRAHLLVSALRLKGFAARLDYQRPGGLAARGPISADLNAQAEFAGGAVKSARVQGNLDMKSAALVLGPLRKEERRDLSVEFDMRGTGTDMVVDRLDVKSFIGRMSARGAIGHPLKPKLNLEIAAQPVDLSELRVAVPEFRDKIPKGELRARLRLVGAPDTSKPWNDWPMEVSGEVAAELPEYKLASAAVAPPSTPAPSAKAVVPAAEPFLPPGRLTSSANVKVSVSVATVVKDALVAKSVGGRGRVARGRFQGEAQVGQVFGGSVRASGLDVPLLDRHPVIRGAIDWSQITIEDAVGFAKPELKNMASGKSTGRAEFVTIMPGEEAFLRSLKVKGDSEANPLTLNSVKIGDIVNELLQKVPVLKMAPAKVEPLHGRMRAQFELASEVAQISSFDAHDKDGSELNLKGKVFLANMQADLTGQFHWVQDRVKGCLAEGNSDDKGRLVVPLAVKGDVLKPNFNVLSDMVGKLAGRALECEKNKLIERVKKEGTEGLKKELDKTLKGLFGR